MNLVVLHRIPYYKINYAKGIDHRLHNVTYVGTKQLLDTIPSNLSCIKIERPGKESAFQEYFTVLKSLPRIDRIVCFSEYELVEAAKLREAFNVPGPNVMDALAVRDKMLMKEKVSRAGIKTPKALDAIQFLEEVESGFSSWRGTTVVKPKMGASSENVQILDTPKLAALVLRQNHLNCLGEYECEEFIDGSILHVDGIVDAGKPSLIVPSRYIGTCLGYALGEALGSVQIPLTKEIEEITIESIKAVGITSGAYHLELIESDQGLTFLEIANRVGGADVVDTFEMATGVHLPSEELKQIVSAEYFPKSCSAPRGYFGWYVLPGHLYSGNSVTVSGTENLKDHPYVLRMKVLSRGTATPTKISYQPHEVPFSAVLGHKHSEELRYFMESISRVVKVSANENFVKVAQ